MNPDAPQAGITPDEAAAAEYAALGGACRRPHRPPLPLPLLVHQRPVDVAPVRPARVVYRSGVVYRQAKTQGMTHVTLTDRDTIEGALRLAHHDDFIIGEEVTAFFPAEALHADVLVWGLNEQQHREIQQLRFDIRELAAYLHTERLVARPRPPVLFRMGGLRLDHYEQLMLLFGLWELLNGSSSQAENEVAARCAAVSGGLLARLAEKHARRPRRRRCSASPAATTAAASTSARRTPRSTLAQPDDDPLRGAHDAPAGACAASAGHRREDRPQRHQRGACRGAKQRTPAAG